MVLGVFPPEIDGCVCGICVFPLRLDVGGLNLRDRGGCRGCWRDGLVGLLNEVRGQSVDLCSSLFHQILDVECVFHGRRFDISEKGGRDWLSRLSEVDGMEEVHILQDDVGLKSDAGEDEHDIAVVELFDGDARGGLGACGDVGVAGKKDAGEVVFEEVLSKLVDLFRQVIVELDQEGRFLEVVDPQVSFGLLAHRQFHFVTHLGRQMRRQDLKPTLLGALTQPTWCCTNVFDGLLQFADAVQHLTQAHTGRLVQCMRHPPVVKQHHKKRKKRKERWNNGNGQYNDCVTEGGHTNFRERYEHSGM